MGFFDKLSQGIKQSMPNYEYPDEKLDRVLKEQWHVIETRYVPEKMKEISPYISRAKLDKSFSSELEQYLNKALKTYFQFGLYFPYDSVDDYPYKDKEEYRKAEDCLCSYAYNLGVYCKSFRDGDKHEVADLFKDEIEHMVQYGRKIANDSFPVTIHDR
jgi:hypothetical protein